ncbi:MAG: 16S rRNA (adenine(1518)-N(6)/adenine(1519)-N(6))-dimethyltransferase RsmA [bacterium]
MTNKKELIGYLQSHGLYTNHGLGQNFLVNREVLDNIVEAAGISADDFVLEIGPGVGTLTRELVSRAKTVLAVEIDKKLAELLPSLFESDESLQQIDNLKIINDDIMQVNLNEILPDRPYKLVANIPYYITSKIMELFLTTKNKPTSITLLVQKEVGERICAEKGHMSVLALSIQVFGIPKITSIVKRESFFPAPNVDSAILKIDNIKQWDQSISEKEFFRCVRIGFSSKRKILAKNLSVGYSIEKKNAEGIILKVGLSADIRAQALGIDDWIKVATELKNA